MLSQKQNAWKKWTKHQQVTNKFKELVKTWQAVNKRKTHIFFSKWKFNNRQLKQKEDKLDRMVDILKDLQFQTVKESYCQIRIYYNRNYKLQKVLKALTYNFKYDKIEYWFRKWKHDYIYAKKGKEYIRAHDMIDVWKQMAFRKRKIAWNKWNDKSNVENMYKVIEKLKNQRKQNLQKAFTTWVNYNYYKRYEQKVLAVLNLKRKYNKYNKGRMLVFLNKWRNYQKEENPWKKKVYNIIAKNSHVSIQVAFWRLRDLENSPQVTNEEKVIKKVKIQGQKSQKNATDIAKKFALRTIFRSVLKQQRKAFTKIQLYDSSINTAKYLRQKQQQESSYFKKCGAAQAMFQLLNEKYTVNFNHGFSALKYHIKTEEILKVNNKRIVDKNTQIKEQYKENIQQSKELMMKKSDLKMQLKEVNFNTQMLNEKMKKLMASKFFNKI